MRNATQAVASCLSADLKTFAGFIREHVDSGDALTPDGVGIIITAFEMFAIEAKTLEDEKLLLESRLLAADCRVEALTIPDFLSDHLRDAAIREGVQAGSVIDLRAVFLDEQDFNREEDEGDAA